MSGLVESNNGTLVLFDWSECTISLQLLKFSLHTIHSCIPFRIKFGRRLMGPHMFNFSLKTVVSAIFGKIWFTCVSKFWVIWSWMWQLNPYVPFTTQRWIRAPVIALDLNFPISLFVIMYRLEFLDLPFSIIKKLYCTTGSVINPYLIQETDTWQHKPPLMFISSVKK